MTTGHDRNPPRRWPDGSAVTLEQEAAFTRMADLVQRIQSKADGDRAESTSPS